jgi:hypothetical protein
LVNAAPHFQIGDATRNLQAKGRPEDHLSVVCFGASAGGFEAYCTILSLLPADTGMAYIIVHHQAADGKSLLVEILPRVTKMPVVLVTDGENVRANHVYVVPAGMQVTMAGDAFRRWSNSPAGPRTFPSSCNPLRKIGKNGRSRSSSQDSIPMGRQHLSRSRKRAALCLPRNFKRPASRTCREAPLRPDALTSFYRRPRSPSNWDALARSGR